MAKFNVRQTIRTQVQEHPDATVNYEGGLAFNVAPKVELYLRAASCLVGENKFYVDGKTYDAELRGLIQAVGKEDAEFLLRLAAYCRNELYLRSVSQVLLAEATQFTNVRRWVPHIVKRADEPGEVLAYYVSRFGRKFSRSLLKGLGDTLPKFGEYALAKYTKPAAFKIRDVFRLVRPKPRTPEQAELWKKAVHGGLSIPHTWEVVISKKGNTKAAWESVLSDMGIFAVVRNLRNMLKAGVDVGPIKDKITGEAVLKSKMLPFRWHSAYKAVQEQDGIDPFAKNAILERLGDAIDWSVANVPNLLGKTFIAIDTSGSMSATLSQKTTVTYWDTAAILGAMAYSICEESAVVGFDSDLNFPVFDKRGSLLVNMAQIKGSGGATYGYKVMEFLLKGVGCDRIILLSDLQCYNEQAPRYGTRWYWDSDPNYKPTGLSFAELWRKYKQQYPKCRLYSVDLAGYGTSQFPEGDAVLLAGWSDRIFDFIGLYEREPTEAVEMISRYVPKRFSFEKEGGDVGEVKEVTPF